MLQSQISYNIYDRCKLLVQLLGVAGPLFFQHMCKMINIEKLITLVRWCIGELSIPSL